MGLTLEPLVDSHVDLRPPGEVGFITQPRFEAGDPRYAWPIGVVMRISLVLAMIAAACTAAPALAAGASDSEAHHAHQAAARPVGATGSEVITTGRILAGDNGTSFRLQPDTGQDAYVLAVPDRAEPTLQLDDLVGKRVRVTATIVEEHGARVLRPTAIVEEHDHARAPHDGVLGMAGDRHLELVVTTSGQIRVYLLDAFMDGIDARGVTGDVVIQTRDRATRSAPLRAGPERGLFVVEGARRRSEDDDITVTLNIGAEQVRMILPFAPETSDHGHDHHPH